MSIPLTHVGRTPGQTQFGLDTFTEHYRANEAADVVLADTTVPDTQMIAVHPDYPFMFVTARYVAETGEKASALDVTYSGCIRDSGGEDPTPALPSQQQNYGNPIQSQSSTRNGVSATVNFYAKTSVLRFITYLDPGSLDTVPDPSGDPTPISIVTNDVAYSPGTVGFDSALDFYFSVTDTDTIDSQELVPGKFWQNTETKTKYYGPFLLACSSFSGGKSMCIYVAGTGYSVSDTLTFSYGGGSASITVDTVNGAGAITGFTIDSDTISAPIFLVISASGGTGSGASFQFFGA